MSEIKASEGINKILELYRNGYTCILNELTENIDRLMSLLSEEGTTRVSIEIVIEACDVPRYSIKTEKVPSNIFRR